MFLFITVARSGNKIVGGGVATDDFKWPLWDFKDLVWIYLLDSRKANVNNSIEIHEKKKV